MCVLCMFCVDWGGVKNFREGKTICIVRVIKVTGNKQLYIGLRLE